MDKDRTSDYLESIQRGREKEPEAQMVVCMVPNDNKTRYDAIKKHCCLDKPSKKLCCVHELKRQHSLSVPNQVIRSQTLAKNVVSVCTKVVLQMNCKLGGSLWRVNIPVCSSTLPS